MSDTLFTAISPLRDEFRFSIEPYPRTKELMVIVYYRPRKRIKFYFYRRVKLKEMISAIPAIQESGKFCFYKSATAETISGSEAVRLVEWLKSL